MRRIISKIQTQEAIFPTETALFGEDFDPGSLPNPPGLPWLSIPTCRAPATVAARLGNPDRNEDHDGRSHLVHDVFDSKNFGFKLKKNILAFGRGTCVSEFLNISKNIFLFGI
jgi:hypothetical protein